MPRKYFTYHMYDVESSSDNEETTEDYISDKMQKQIHDNLFEMCEWYFDQHLLFLNIQKCNFETWTVPQYTPYNPDYLQFTQIFNRETYFAWLKMNNLPIRYKYTGVHWGEKKYNENDLLWMKNFVNHFIKVTGIENKSWIWHCLLQVVSY